MTYDNTLTRVRSVGIGSSGRGPVPVGADSVIKAVIKPVIKPA